MRLVQPSPGAARTDIVSVRPLNCPARAGGATVDGAARPPPRTSGHWRRTAAVSMPGADRPLETQNKFLFVIPAKAGIQFLQYPAVTLDPGLRRDDGLFSQSLEHDARQGTSTQLCRLSIALEGALQSPGLIRGLVPAASRVVQVRHQLAQPWRLKAADAGRVFARRWWRSAGCRRLARDAPHSLTCCAARWFSRGRRSFLSAPRHSRLRSVDGTTGKVQA